MDEYGIEEVEERKGEEIEPNSALDHLQPQQEWELPENRQMQAQIERQNQEKEQLLKKAREMEQSINDQSNMNTQMAKELQNVQSQG